MKNYDQLYAIRFNTKASGRIWKHHEIPLPFVDLVAHSEAFAEACALFQSGAGLVVDGCLGHKTLAALRAVTSASTVGMTVTSGDSSKPAIQVEEPEAGDGSQELEIDTKTFRSTAGKKRTKAPVSIVLHDSITATAKACHSVLERRKLSTHYMIDEKGKVFECADPGTRTTYHASAFNNMSIGVDMIALLSPSQIKRDNAPNRERKKRLVSRAWSAHKSKKVIDYTPEQKKSLYLLVRHLCEEFDIPFAAPEQLTGYGKKIDVDANEYTGIIAHGQFSSKRWDGLLAVEVLHEEGCGVA